MVQSKSGKMSAAQKAALTRKRKHAGKKAALTRKRKKTAQKAVEMRKKRALGAAAQKAWENRKENVGTESDKADAGTEQLQE
jgi:hypothetical protein